MAIRTPDGREHRKAERDDAAVAALRDGREAWLDREIALAKTLHQIDRKCAFLFEGSASAVELAAKLGYDGHRAIDLLWLGRAIAAEPKVEELLRARRIILPTACWLGRILPHPEYVEPGEDWLHAAQFQPFRTVRRLVKRRVEQKRRAAKKLRRYVLLVDDLEEYDLDRCRRLLVEREKNVRLTAGQAIGMVARDWLERNDPVEKRVGPRRVGPTAENLDDRYLPRAVVAAIFRRSGGFCEVGGCNRLIEEICHIRSHRSGSPREERDLFGACHAHHVLYDAEPAYVSFLGWSPEGRPIFFNRRMERIAPVPRPTREISDDMLRPFLAENAAAEEIATTTPSATATEPRWPDVVRDGPAPTAPARERRRRGPAPGWTLRSGESLHHQVPPPRSVTRPRARAP